LAQVVGLSCHHSLVLIIIKKYVDRKTKIR